MSVTRAAGVSVVLELLGCPLFGQSLMVVRVVEVFALDLTGVGLRHLHFLRACAHAVLSCVLATLGGRALVDDFDFLVDLDWAVVDPDRTVRAADVFIGKNVSFVV